MCAGRSPGSNLRNLQDGVRREPTGVPGRRESVCYNLRSPVERRYRLGVRTEDSQSSNPGSIPGSATNSLLSSRDFSDTYEQTLLDTQTHRDMWWVTVEAQMGHNLGHSENTGRF